MTVYRHNPLLKSRLLAFLANGDAQGMRVCLTSLTVSDFRSAGRLLAEEVLPSADNDAFWHFFRTIVPTNPKAYLGTFLKAAVKLYRQGKLQLQESRFADFSRSCSVIDKRKFLEALLPEAKTDSEVRVLVSAFCQGQIAEAAPYLLRAHTPQTYYVLFQLLKTADAELVRKYALLLLRNADSLSFNLASILEQYFDLAPLPGNFSLRLQPYQLNCLDRGYEAFLKYLKG